MPTGYEYRGAAYLMQAHAEACEGVGKDLQHLRYDTGIQGGKLEGDIDTALDASMINAYRAAEQCRQLADEFVARAIVCEEYANALAIYQARDRNWVTDNAAYQRSLKPDSDHCAPPPGRRPSPPPTPPSWVSTEGTLGSRS